MGRVKSEEKTFYQYIYIIGSGHSGDISGFVIQLIGYCSVVYSAITEILF
jgi:hypothetical protein